MVEEVEHLCKLEFSLAFALIVLACNIGKVCAIAFLLWKYRAPLLVTIGDAIASFLEEPDPTTKGRPSRQQPQYQLLM